MAARGWPVDDNECVSTMTDNDLISDELETLAGSVARPSLSTGIRITSPRCLSLALIAQNDGGPLLTALGVKRLGKRRGHAGPNRGSGR